MIIRHAHRIIYATPFKDQLTFTANVPTSFTNVLSPPLIANETTTIALRKILIHTADNVSQAFSVSCNLLAPTGQPGNSLGVYIITPHKKHFTVLEEQAPVHSVRIGHHPTLNVRLENLDLDRTNTDLNITAIVLEFFIADDEVQNFNV